MTENLMTYWPFLPDCNPCSFLPQEANRLKWGNSRKGLYTVKEGYCSLCSSNSMIDKWLSKHIWETNYLPKRSVSAGLHCTTHASHRIISPKRNSSLPTDATKHTESVNHLLLQCTVASDLWKMLCSFSGLSWIMPFSIRDALESWS